GRACSPRPQPLWPPTGGQSGHTAPASAELRKNSRAAGWPAVIHVERQRPGESQPQGRCSRAALPRSAKRITDLRFVYERVLVKDITSSPVYRIIRSPNMTKVTSAS